MSGFPPVAEPQRHYGHIVWDDEDYSEGAYYMGGHVPKRRAIAAANRYARVEQGLVNLADDKAAPLSWVRVQHGWWKPSAEDSDYNVFCEPSEDGAEPYTEVSL